MSYFGKNTKELREDDRASIETRQMITTKEKEANNFAWYKKMAKRLDRRSYASGSDSILSSYKHRKEVNYNLANGFLNMDDFDYILKKYGDSVKLNQPAKLTHRDIMNKRIKKLLGMEQKRKMTYRVMAVNPEATTRKEEEEASRIRNHVTDLIMKPIRERAALELERRTRGRELTPEEQSQIQQEIEQSIEDSTPDRVRRYMHRKHQDPAEVQANHILKDAILRHDMYNKTNKCFHHFILTGDECMFVGLRGNRPSAEVVNMLYFDYDMNPQHTFIEEGDWCTYQQMLAKSQILDLYGDQLTKKEISDIYKYNIGNDSGQQWNFAASSRGVRFDGPGVDIPYLSYSEDYGNHDSVPVTHCEWIGLRRMGFLYREDGTVDYVDETYKPSENERVEYEWLPELYRTTIILNDIFVDMGPVPGQFRDVENPTKVELSYKGIRMDHLNALPTSLLDRMKEYNYMYNIISYRKELLMAADKGKKVAININMVPESNGVPLETWMDYFDGTPFVFYNPNEEGVDPADVQNSFRVIDLSTTKQISDYINMMEYYDRACGESVGITDAVLGQQSASTEVGLARQNAAQTSDILDPYFQAHEMFKKRCFNALLTACKIAYSMNPPEFLNYITDDMGQEMFKLDIDLLENSTYGLYVQDNSKFDQIRENLQALAHAAMQSESIPYSAIIKLQRMDDMQEAEEHILAAEEQQQQRNQRAATQEHKNAMELAEKQLKDAMALSDHNTMNEIKVVNAKGEIDLQKQAMLSLGFNENKDVDNDGVPDILEILRSGKDAEIKARELDIKQQEVDIKRDGNKLKAKEIAQKNAISAKS